MLEKCVKCPKVVHNSLDSLVQHIFNVHGREIEELLDMGVPIWSYMKRMVNPAKIDEID